MILLKCLKSKLEESFLGFITHACAFANTFVLHSRPLKLNDNRKEEKKSATPHFNITAKSFIPTGQFDPFQPYDDKEEEEDDVINDLSQHLISRHLLDEEEEEEENNNVKGSLQQTSKKTPFVWDTQKEWKPTGTTTTTASKIQDIWNPKSIPTPLTVNNEVQQDDWNRFAAADSSPTSNTSSYSRKIVEGDEFDPTLQFYHGSLYDANTIQDMNLLSLNVTNPSLEETEAENVAEDMSTLQMMQTIFSDISDQELQETLATHDYDVDRAIESLLMKKGAKVASSAQVEASGTVATIAMAPTTTKKRQVCRHFLAGECYRKDCWFVHDLQEKVCKFW